MVELVHRRDTSRRLASAALGLLAGLLAGCAASASPNKETALSAETTAAAITGAAIYSERITLPATFRGDLPCADCAAIRHHLDLWPDQVFHLRREWLGKDEAMVHGDMGRWHFDPARRALILHGGTEMPLQFEILGPDRLRLLDTQGRPIESKLSYELESIGRIEMADIPGFFLGHMTYMADSPRFTECLTGRNYPIAPGAEALMMKREYLARVATPGGPLLMHFEGELAQRPGMEGDRLEPTWVVTRFIATRTDERCPQPVSQAALTNTYWRINGQNPSLMDAAGAELAQLTAAYF